MQPNCAGRSTNSVSSLTEPGRHRVVIVGGGFGGIQAARVLRRLPVEITLIDRRNFHLFQPLVYQVATGALAPGEIATPLRAIFKRNENVRVVLGEVSGFHLAERQVELDRLPTGVPPRRFSFDSLIVAAGSAYSYFGHDEWMTLAPDVKALERALEVRRRILLAFEAAELEEDAAARASWLTFVVVGAGPTAAPAATTPPAATTTAPPATTPPPVTIVLTPRQELRLARRAPARWRGKRGGVAAAARMGARSSD